MLPKFIKKKITNLIFWFFWSYYQWRLGGEPVYGALRLVQILSVKGAWSDLKKKSSLLTPWNWDFDIRIQLIFFWLLLQWNFRPQWMFNLYVMNKNGAKFHKSVVTTPKVYAVFYEMVLQTYLWLVWKPLELFCSKFGSRLFGWWCRTWKCWKINLAKTCR